MAVSPFVDSLCFPQAVEVAIGVDRLHLVAVGEGEGDFGGLLGSQCLALVAGLGLEAHPLDVVGGDHGMGHRAHLDLHQVPLLGPDGKPRNLGVLKFVVK